MYMLILRCPIVTEGIYIYIRGVFGKYVDKLNRIRIKYARQMKFCILNEYLLLNIKYDQYENFTLINDLDIGH